MASLPPRKCYGVKTNRQPLTPLQILLQMGFPKNRAEKALAATGNRGVQLASDWLLAHVSDPTLDDNSPREYILYLCPTGPLLEQLLEFYSDSLIQCGRNGAHNYLPHITLCSFFQAPDESEPHLVQALSHVVDRIQPELPSKLDLEFYSSPTFLGLFIAHHHSDVLKRLAVNFMREVSDFVVSEMGALDVLGTCFPWCSSAAYPSLSKGASRRRIQVEPYLKGLHITLAYQFTPEHAPTLEELAKRIDLSAPAGPWELRLYSRDPRIKGNQVHKVLYSYVPREPDELEMLIGDFVYVNGDALANEDGWVEGTSWLTGLSGYLPKNYIERTAESDAWSLHKTFSLFTSTEKGDKEDLKKQGEKTDSAPIRTSKLKRDSLGNFHSIAGIPRQIFVVRHGERVDFTFGHSWISTCFDNAGNYTSAKDLNLPASIPQRDTPVLFKMDSPLTKIGLYQASLTGEAFKEAGISFSHAFSSPSLRCIQTCTNMIKNLPSKREGGLKIKVEPGLFEWAAWYHQDGLPHWMTAEELAEAGYPIDTDYAPVVMPLDIRTIESCEQFYLRSHLVVQAILLNQGGNNVLLVGHSSTLDTCTRQLCGKSPRSTNGMMAVLQKVPYCGLVVAREGDGGNWSLVQPPIAPLRHAGNVPFDWNCLLNS